MIREVIGVDPGSKGAIAKVSICNGQLVDLTIAKIPPEFIALQELLKEMTNEKTTVYVEQVGTFVPSNVSSRTSMFSFGVGYGKLVAALESIEQPFETLTPQVWQKSIGANRHPGKPKARATKCALNIFGSLNHFIFKRSRTPHDGALDASLIALAGFNIFEKGNFHG